MQYRLLEKQARAGEALAAAGHMSSRDRCRQTQPDAAQAAVVRKLPRLLKARKVDCSTVGFFLGSV
jgi:hypothetical protein